MSSLSSRRASARFIERCWQGFSVLAIAALSLWYIAVHRNPAADRYHFFMLAIGWIGTVLSILAAAFTIRKRMAYQGIGKLSVWLNAHIYLGLVAAFSILFHAGFRMGGLLTSALLSFFAIAIVSGLLGWWISRKVPPLLTAIEEKPAILEDLISMRADCLRGLLELAAEGSVEFRSLVAERLLKDCASWRRIVRFCRNRSTLLQELPNFRGEYETALQRIPPVEQPAFLRAIEYALQVNKMNAELFLQRLLRGWLTLHVVSTTLMFGLAAIHIFSVLYY